MAKKRRKKTSKTNEAPAFQPAVEASGTQEVQPQPGAGAPQGYKEKKRGTNKERPLPEEELIFKPLPWKRILIIAAILLAIVATCFANSLSNQFVFDDREIVVNNPLIRSFDNFTEAFKHDYWYPYASSNLYRPLVIISYMFDYAFWGGLKPYGFRITNILIHFINCMLLFFIVHRLFGSWKVGFASALLFAVHPVHVEGVTSIIGRNESISAMFFLISWYSYMRFKDSEHKGWRRWIGLGVALTGYFCALLSKESSAPLPGVLILTDILRERDRRGSLWTVYRATVRNLPYYLGFAAILMLVLFVIRPAILGSALALPGAGKGSTRRHMLGDPYARFLTAPHLFCLYLRLLLVPFPLKAHYPLREYNVPKTFFEPKIILGFIVVAGLVFAAFILPRLLKRWGFTDRSKEELERGARPYRFALLMYMGTLFLMSHLPFPMGTFMAERFCYLPSIAFCLIAGYAVITVGRAPFKWIVRGVFLAVVLVFGILCIARNPIWKNTYTMFTDTVSKTPLSSIGRMELATAFIRKRQFHKAIDTLHPIIHFDHYHKNTRVNLGKCYLELKRVNTAEQFFLYEIKMDKRRYHAHLGLGVIYQIYKKNYRKAIHHYSSVIRLRPRHQQRPAIERAINKMRSYLQRYGGRR